MKRTLSILTLGAMMSVSGCTYFNEEAGAFLDQGEFGNATMNNHLAHTCRKLTPANVSKYGNPISSNCPGREQDGKYALFSYNQTVPSAEWRHPIGTNLRDDTAQ